MTQDDKQTSETYSDEESCVSDVESELSPHDTVTLRKAGVVECLISDAMANVVELQSTLRFENGKYGLKTVISGDTSTKHEEVLNPIKDLHELISRKLVLSNGSFDRPLTSLFLESNLVASLLLPLWEACTHAQDYESLKYLLIIIYQILQPLDNGLKEAWGPKAVEQHWTRLRSNKKHFVQDRFWDGFDQLHAYLVAVEPEMGLSTDKVNQRKQLQEKLKILESGQTDVDISDSEEGDTRIDKLFKIKNKLQALEEHATRSRRLIAAALGAWRAIMSFLLRIEDHPGRDWHLRLVSQIMKRGAYKVFANEWHSLLVSGGWKRAERSESRTNEYGDPVMGDTQRLWHVLDFYYHLIFAFVPNSCGWLILRHMADEHPELNTYMIEDLEDEKENKHVDIDNRFRNSQSLTVSVFRRPSTFNPYISERKRKSMYINKSQYDRKGVRKYLMASYVLPSADESAGGFLDMSVLKPLESSFIKQADSFVGETEKVKELTMSITEVLSVKVAATLAVHIVEFIELAFNKLLEGWLSDCAAQDILVSMWDSCKLMNLITWILMCVRTVVQVLVPIDDKAKRCIPDSGHRITNLGKRILTLVSACRVALEVKCIVFVLSRMKREINVAKASSRKKQLLKAAMRLCLEQTRWACRLTTEQPSSSVLFMIGKAVSETLTQNGLTSAVIKFVEMYTPRRFDPEFLLSSIEIIHMLFLIVDTLGGFLNIRKTSRRVVHRKNAHRHIRPGDEEEEESDSPDGNDEDTNVENAPATGELKKMSSKQLISNLRDGRIITNLFDIIRTFLTNSLEMNVAAITILKRVSSINDDLKKSDISDGSVLFFDLKSLEFAIMAIEALRLDPEIRNRFVNIVPVVDFAKLIIWRFWALFEINRFLPLELMYSKRTIATPFSANDIEVCRSVISNYTEGADYEIIKQSDDHYSKELRRHVLSQRKMKANPWTPQEDRTLTQLYELSRHLPVQYLVKQIKKQFKTARTHKEIRERLVKLTVISESAFVTATDEQENGSSSDEDDEHVPSATARSVNTEKHSIQFVELKYRLLGEALRIIIQTMEGKTTSEQLETAKLILDSLEVADNMDILVQLEYTSIVEFLDLASEEKDAHSLRELKKNHLKKALAAFDDSEETLSDITKCLNLTQTFCAVFKRDVSSGNTNANELFRSCLLAIVYHCRLNDEDVELPEELLETESFGPSVTSMANSIANEFLRLIKSRKRHLYSFIHERLTVDRAKENESGEYEPPELTFGRKQTQNVFNLRSLVFNILVELMGCVTVEFKDDEWILPRRTAIHSLEFRTVKLKNFLRLTAERLSDMGGGFSTISSQENGSDSVHDFEFHVSRKRKLDVRPVKSLSGDVVHKLADRILVLRSVTELQLTNIVSSLQELMMLLCLWLREKYNAEMQNDNKISDFLLTTNEEEEQVSSNCLALRQDLREQVYGLLSGLLSDKESLLKESSEFLGNIPIMRLETWSFPLGPYGDCLEYRRCLHSLLGMPDDPWRPTMWRWQCLGIPAAEYLKLTKLGYIFSAIELKVLERIVGELESVEQEEDIWAILEKSLYGFHQPDSDIIVDTFEDLFPTQTEEETHHEDDLNLEGLGGDGTIFESNSQNDAFPNRKARKCSVHPEESSNEIKIQKCDVVPSSDVVENAGTTRSLSQIIFDENFEMLREFFKCSDKGPVPSDKPKAVLPVVINSSFTEWALQECSRIIEGNLNGKL